MTRNSSFFKRVNNDVDIDADDSWDDADVCGNHPVAPGQPVADAPLAQEWAVGNYLRLGIGE